MKKKLLLILLLLMPFNVLAYSDKLIIEGKPIGIEVHSKGIYITDTYKVKGKSPKNIKKGDLIKKVNNKEVNNISEFNNAIIDEGTYDITLIRNSEEINTTLKVVKENSNIKTGLYLKDQINGIGTLSYIDPETKIFASLGHEILENNSMSLFNIKNGYIYDLNVNNINKNTRDKVGEFKGTFTNTLIGTINKNEINGIFGMYTDNIENKEQIEISDEIKKEKAYLRLNLDNSITKDYEIKIINIDEKDSVKNIHFEVTDKELLETTGGIIQGMSGTPIIQNEKIIGVVNYVIVEDNTKGYGIFIKKMLEEGDKLLKE